MRLDVRKSFPELFLCVSYYMAVAGWIRACNYVRSQGKKGNF